MVSALKHAFEAGARAARTRFKVADDDDPHPRSFLRKALPYLAAGGAGLAGYKLLRTPRFSANPALRKIQELANRKGFHRVVDVTHAPLPQGASIGERLEHFATPHADAQGNLSRFNRLKLFLREGTTEAIPVAWRPQGGPAGSEHISGHRGPKKYEGVIWNRHGISGSETPRAVRGGVDLEGPTATQDALHRLSVKGKSYEAHLVQKHAPGDMPETHTRFSGMSMRDLAHGLEHAAPEDAARELQQRVLSNHGPDYMVKTDTGLASGVGGGGFPRSGDGDWGEELKRYNTHFADPKNQAAFDGSEGNAAAHYLRSRGLYRGHVITEALKNPDNTLIQKLIPGIENEYRVHTIAGTVPRSLLLTRDSGTLKSLRQTPARLGVGQRGADVQTFAQGFLDKLPAKYRDGNFALDIVSHRNPDGTLGHKVIELNPTEHATVDSAAGGSGHLPWVGPRHYRAVTGRETPLTAGLGGAAAAAAAGLGTRAVADATDDDDQ